ncbi:3-deoxy-manno-octulosonate cytidylyltransferase [Cronbergia sp. UHCC 0137]|uniref:3-deoxy-manno-octulosonate cytidylyltransferase n=1 Tax=Cronbergia sp. UHCC 0137 TaxID=3110239 RepID=UPI002B1F0C68|nr:3-deoxy-manno-octulosonate cytidylyltransferase [Cronbergia sp. UHCC 0137]MEA5618355.1 3-deoxy-manno-octulosonate cytidylyltransferase [Cronbergia sp. UHCC 0137]
MINYVVIIPARYESSRLPGKPLIDLCGLPMVVRTYQQCLKAFPMERVYVATDDIRIHETCKNYQIQTIMTSSECLTGTDRVAECANQLDADIFLNVQGDEPVFNPSDLKSLLRAVECFPNDILNGYCVLDQEAMFRSGNIPKVVMRSDGRLLYMSRAAIPSTKEHGFKAAFRQVCAYAFPKAALNDFAKQSQKTPLETIEDIEILRFLELGWEVRMIQMSNVSVAVDTYEDIKRAEAAIQFLETRNERFF